MEQERQDREPEEGEVELESGVQVVGGREELDRVAEGRAEVNLVWGRDQEGRVPWPGVPAVSGRGRVDRAQANLVWGRDRADRVRWLEVRAVSGRDQADRAAEVQRVWGLGQEGRVPWLEVPVVSGRGRVDRVAAE